MGLIDLFRRKPAIRDQSALATFIDENAAFLVQKGIYEYSRARAGHYAKVLFREPGFKHAVEVSRWRAYPLGLLMVSEMVEGALRASAADRHAALDAVSALALGIFDRYPVSPELGDQAWGELRAELTRQLALIALHPPKRAIDIPEQWARAYFDLLPVHEELRTREFPTIRSYLRVTLCNIHDELMKRLDLPAVAATMGRSQVA
jgi:hypothetical protein